MIKAYLQIALYVKNTGAGFYARYKEPFLKTIAGAKSKELLVRDEGRAGASRLWQRRARKRVSKNRTF